MPTAWTDKQERKYEHIRDSEREQGASLGRAKEIAARTVNKRSAWLLPGRGAVTTKAIPEGGPRESLLRRCGRPAS